MEVIPPIEPSSGRAAARTVVSALAGCMSAIVWALSVWKTWKCQGVLFASEEDGSRCENSLLIVMSTGVLFSFWLNNL